MKNNILFIKGIIISIIVLMLDQLHKWCMLELVDIDNRDAIEVLPFFNLVMVWNRGISFGMGQSAQNPQLIFSAIAIVIVIGLLFWMAKSQSAFLSAALGFIIGGALGNLVDRFRFGAVADFFDFHVSGYHWPAFNIADSAVFIGVVMLFIDSLFEEKMQKKKNAKKRS